MDGGLLSKKDMHALFWTVLFLSILALGSPAEAQGKPHRIGLLSAGNDQLLPGQRTTWRSGLLQVLEQHGYQIGRNLEFIERYSGGNNERLPELAAEIAKANVDIVVAVADQSLRAMLAETANTPIVMVVGADPVASGFVASLARPGGRVTGIAFQTLAGDVKRLQLLHEAIPAAHTFGYLRPPGPVPSGIAKSLQEASNALGVRMTTHAVTALEPAAYEAAFAAMRTEGCAAVLVAATQQLAIQAPLFGPVAKSFKLPTMCEWDYMAHTDCVMSYGHDLDYARRRVGDYVVRILGGALPADLPVEETDVWKLTINLVNAVHTGVALPAAITARADDVVE